MFAMFVLDPHSGILKISILLTVGQPASYDAGIRGKPLGGFPPNPLSLVLTDGVQGSRKVDLVMPKGLALRTAIPSFQLLNSTMLREFGGATEWLPSRL